MEMAVDDVPAHVPQELVVDFDYRRQENLRNDPHGSWKALHDGPDIIWSPHNDGHWILTRARDMKDVLRNHEVFSSKEVTIPRLDIGISAPIQFDPPDHTRLKALGIPLFTPNAIRKLEQGVRDQAQTLIDSFLERGECEFIEEFALRLPIDTFMDMAGLPKSDRAQLLDWMGTSMRSPDRAARDDAQMKLGQYADEVVDARLTSPGQDLVSQLMIGRETGERASEDELRGYTRLLLAAGLDTVSSGMGFMFRFLAENPEHARQLAVDPKLIPAALEELLRRFGVSSPARIVARDTELNGVKMRKGDMILVPVTLAGIDEREYPDPLTVDFSRPNASHSLVFGLGIHRCIGSFLARLELRIALEEWLARIPEFRLGGEPVSAAGLVNSMISLPLRWDAR